MISTSFDATSLERRYAFLDDCPDELFSMVVTLPIGELSERVAGVRRWTEALLEGHLPSPDTWPPGAVVAPVRRTLEKLGIARFCKQQPELVTALMKDILTSLTRHHETLQADVARRLEELAELERVKLEAAEEDLAHREEREPREVELDQRELEEQLIRAEQEAATDDGGEDAEILMAWEDRVRAWVAISDAFGDLGQMLGRGWDLSVAVLRHTGWQELLRLKQLVERLPQLREIIQALGRLRDSSEQDSISETLFQPVTRLEEELQEVTTPLVPAETRGIERSGEIARMLPAEAAMLGHPKLRLLWHARRAERALLTYLVQGVEYEATIVERDTLEEIDGERPRLERGPIMAVIDTSGSMHGRPEQVAKALVLEALSTAHAERRPCFLYAYSGPGNIIEHELDLAPEGIGRLLDFLGFSFWGGNDETGVMLQVVARLEEEAWTKADVMWVSDGEWPVPYSLTSAVERARALGTRFHGVQIGNRGRTGLHAVCDPVHVFQDWAEVGGWRA